MLQYISYLYEHFTVWKTVWKRVMSSLNFDLTVPFYNIAFDKKKFPMLF